VPRRPLDYDRGFGGSRKRSWVAMIRYGWLGGGLIAVLALMPFAASAYDAPDEQISNMLTLPLAASNHDFHAVLIMLGGGTSVDTEGRDGRAALSYAVANGDMQIVDLLLKHSADVDHRDDFGDTALHWAALAGQTEMVKRLLAAKATIDAQNKEGTTPLMLAINNNRREVVRLLLSAGASTTIEDYTGHDAMSYARRNPQMLPLLQASAH
jgi:ankyrin repeat protein